MTVISNRFIKLMVCATLLKMNCVYIKILWTVLKCEVWESTWVSVKSRSQGISETRLWDTSLDIYGRAWLIAHLPDCPDCQLSRLWQQPIVRPIVSVTDCLLNKPHLAIWLWTQLYQSCAITPTGYENGNRFCKFGKWQSNFVLFLSFCLLNIA